MTSEYSRDPVSNTNFLVTHTFNNRFSYFQVPSTSWSLLHSKNTSKGIIKNGSMIVTSGRD